MDRTPLLLVTDRGYNVSQFSFSALKFPKLCYNIAQKRPNRALENFFKKGIDISCHLCYNRKGKTKNTRSRVRVYTHTRAVRRERQLPKDFFASAFSMLYHYSIFKIFCQELFGFFAFVREALSFCLSFRFEFHLTIECHHAINRCSPAA